MMLLQYKIFIKTICKNINKNIETLKGTHDIVHNNYENGEIKISHLIPKSIYIHYRKIFIKQVIFRPHTSGAMLSCLKL